MKILFLTNSLNMGGIETNLVRLTQGFAQRGHEVVTASSGGRLVDALVAAGGRHVPLQLSLSPFRFPRVMGAIESVIDQEHPDIVHSFSAPAAVGVSAANRFRRLRGGHTSPACSSVMGLNSSPKENPFITRTRAWLTCVGMDKVIVIAPAIGQVLEKTPVPKDRLVSLPVVGVEAPIPANPQQVREIRSELGMGADHMVLTVGNLEPRKSHELFVAAAASVASERNDVRFFIAGDGAERGRIESCIADSGHRDRIVLLGERPDAQALIGAADLYVRPGIVEGFIGITVLEAQARGVPVVSFETEDVKLAIEDGISGCLVPRGDVPAMADAIKELLANHSARRRLGEAGQDYVTRHFSIDSVVAGLESLYASVIDTAELKDRA